MDVLFFDVGGVSFRFFVAQTSVTLNFDVRLRNTQLTTVRQQF